MYGIPTLEERVEQSLAKGKLTTDNSKRLAKLMDIHADLKRGKNVQNRKLQRWLTAEEYSRFEDSWREQQELRKELKDKPDEIKEYEEKLRSALFEYNRADGYSNKRKSKLALEFRHRAERLFEKALEHLDEVLAAEPSLRYWLDRDVEFHDAANSTGLDPVSMPRVITSRSLDNSANIGHKQSKLSVKLETVEGAVNSILRSVEDRSELNRRRAEQLKKFLSMPGDEI